jgi:hypothetical protein
MKRADGQKLPPPHDALHFRTLWKWSEENQEIARSYVTFQS